MARASFFSGRSRRPAGQAALRASVMLSLWLGLAPLVKAKPVEFAFKVPALADAENPFAPEVWAEVVTPSQRRLQLPAYFAGDRTYAVRARPEEAGIYRLGRISESRDGTAVEHKVDFVTPAEVSVGVAGTMPAVSRDPANPALFRTTDGQPITPVGMNLAWARGEVLPYYRSAFARCADADLNWIRIWMAHWGHLNLDWLPERLGTSPKPGWLDARVAANWDQLLAMAEQHGVYVQLVLQHHGQYSSRVNPEWRGHPWNVANGGFLETPAEFFTSERARAITKSKYRYIVARWGWSPAIFAWELFNEVHWVDAINAGRNETTVAAWHDEMADWLRSLDVYRHMVTTSTENLRSPIYAKMDYFQPHLYPSDLTTAARGAPLPPGLQDRPVFYGEVGDDHLDAPAAVKKSGVAIVPPAWVGLFGRSRHAAQPWLGWDILEQDRLRELGAVHRFATKSGFARQSALELFSPGMASDQRVPLRLRGCQVWQRRPGPEIAVPTDGSVPVAYADIPRVLVGNAGGIAEGFPSRITYHLDLDRETGARARIVGTGNDSAGIRFGVNGEAKAERVWKPDAADRPTREKPVEVAFTLPKGKATLVVENTRIGEWVELAEIEFDAQEPVLAASGQRNERFVAVWVWHRTGLLAVEPVPAARGTVVVADLPTGDWTVTWWDTTKGEPAPKGETISHPGGTLRLATPPISRHAAVVLTR